jgi:hypothetical protein
MDMSDHIYDKNIQGESNIIKEKILVMKYLCDKENTQNIQNKGKSPNSAMYANMPNANICNHVQTKCTQKTNKKSI